MSTTSYMSPLGVEGWHRALSTTDGRDKLCRTIQYTCKLVRALDHSVAGNVTLSKVMAVESAMSTTRQILRLFKWTSVYAKRRGSYGTASSAEMLKTMSDVCLFAYYVCDNVTFLCKTKVMRGDVGNAMRRAGRIWLASVVTGLAAGVLRVMELRRRRLRLKREIEMKREETSNERRTEELDVAEKGAVVGCLKNVMDVVVAMNLSSEHGLNPMMVGVCGLVSSLIGGVQVWPKHDRIEYTPN